MMDWISWVLLLVLGGAVFCSWLADRRGGQVLDERSRGETIDFSIYLYSSKRGQTPRADQ
jgi:hypothetical protein